MAVKMTLKQAVKIGFQLRGQELAEVSLRAAAARGALEADKVGKTWYVTEEALCDYLDNRPDHWQYPYRRVSTKNGVRGTFSQSVD